MPVIIKDVAALTGALPLTVDRTYRDHPSTNHQTKEKVRQTVAKLGHEPNFQASSLATQNSRTVGIILSPPEWGAYQDLLYLGMIRRISRYCNQKQYTGTVTTGQNEDKILQAMKAIARTGLAEGLIMLYSRGQDPVLDYLYEGGPLHVLMGKACRNVSQTIYVDNNNILASGEMAEYLLNPGHVRITCLSGGHFLLYNHDRETGYMLVLTEGGILFDNQLCVGVPSMPEEQNQTPEVLFIREDRPTAMLVSGNIPTVTLERTCIGPGLSISGDVSILSFNNSLLSRLTLPSLTSVGVNACQPGVEAATQVINHVENSELVATKIIVPHHLVGRESCARTGRLCGGWDTEIT